MRFQIFILGVTLAAVLWSSPVAFAQVDAADPELVRLRHEWAMKFFEPGPHMKLAKYYREKGNLIQAFYMLENARRYRFDQETFDAAFLLHFGGFAPLDNSAAEEAKYLGLVKASPDDAKLLNHLADIYISRADYTRGEPYLRSSYEKDPLNYRTLLALEELYRRMDKPDVGAKLIKDFLAKYPDSVGGYFFRISRLESDALIPKQLLDDAIKKYPNEGYFWYARSAISRDKNDLDDAEASILKAVELDKNSERYQAAAAGFLRVYRKDINRALGYYLNVYFLNPHAHYDGFAEAKVSNLNSDISKAAVDKAIAGGKKPESLFADPNPRIVMRALVKMVETWDGTKVDVVLGLLRHDDVELRWTAMLALVEKEGNKLDPIVRELLKDSDLRVRGLAAYMAVKLWKEASFPEMKKMLNEESQVLRFDAVSALILHGGAAGKSIVAEHRRKEPSEYLRKMIDAGLAEDKK